MLSDVRNAFDLPQKGFHLIFPTLRPAQISVFAHWHGLLGGGPDGGGGGGRMGLLPRGG